MKITAWLVATCLSVAMTPVASAHPVKKVTAKSICHYEERYFVWTAGERWRVWGHLKPGHGNKKVVLQRTKFGHNWRKWKVTRTGPDGRYRFTGTAPTRNGWWVNLRVVFRAQAGHNRRVSTSMYIDTNPQTGC